MYSAALDTSAGTASFVVVDCKSGVRIVSDHSLAVGKDSAGLLVAMLHLLGQRKVRLGDIVEWTVGVGPGSFTGVRVGISMIRGICAGTGAKCRGVASSLMMAYQGHTDTNDDIAVLHDGRRNELILTKFAIEEDNLVALGDPILVSTDGLSKSLASRFVLLNDNRALPQLDYFRESLVILSHIDAGILLGRDKVVWPEDTDAVACSLDPIYVRPAVFTTPKKVLV